METYLNRIWFKEYLKGGPYEGPSAVPNEVTGSILINKIIHLSI